MIDFDIRNINSFISKFDELSKKKDSSLMSVVRNLQMTNVTIRVACKNVSFLLYFM